MLAGFDEVVRLVVGLGVVSLGQGLQREDRAVEVQDVDHHVSARHELQVGVVLAVVVRIPDR
eukprot:5337026-Heterocapsa_arctica.AAC.1